MYIKLILLKYKFLTREMSALLKAEKHNWFLRLSENSVHSIH